MDKLRESLNQTTFVKLTLSEPRNTELDLRNVYARLVELRRGRRLSLLFRHATRDVTKNLELSAGAAFIGEMLGAQFARAHLFTTDGDWELRCDANGGCGALRAGRPTFSIAVAHAHDRQKNRFIPEDAAFLQALGVTTASGKPRPGMADKLRQVQRFVEILGHLVETSPLSDARHIRVIDLAAGKGYLTFAAHDFFRRRGMTADVTGIEMREDLVAASEKQARTLNCTGLRFERGTISDFRASAEIDVLIALQECDTATDDALHLGIQSEAKLILAAPCCHKELRRQLVSPPLFHDMLKHGILMEHQTEIVTDAIRALILEIHGYDSRVFEFISNEHTAKNLMISAVHRPVSPDPAARIRLRALCDFFGIREQRLARLLGEL